MKIRAARPTGRLSGVRQEMHLGNDFKVRRARTREIPMRTRVGAPSKVGMPNHFDYDEVSARKQPGRRFGPAPKHAPSPAMQAPVPMDSERRRAIHLADGTPQTLRQFKQYWRMRDAETLRKTKAAVR